jgi:hypothetical protein
MSSVREFLKGKKAYLLAAAAVLSAAAAYGSGELELFPALMVIWNGAFGAAIRAGIAKIGG